MENLWFSVFSYVSTLQCSSLPYELKFLMEVIGFEFFVVFFVILRMRVTISKLFTCQNGNWKLGLLFESFVLLLSCFFLLKI